MQRLCISENRRGFMTADGELFFWLGDTAWELFHKLSLKEAEHYLKTRKAQGFNVVQAVLLAEEMGVTVPNFYGRCPLLESDPNRPDLGGEYSYWSHVLAIAELAERYGIYLAVLPAWGDKINRLWGREQEIFNGENAYSYGKFVGELLGDYTHIVWVLGGDRMLTKQRHFEVISRMAEGLKAGENLPHIMTFHPPNACSSNTNHAEAEWLDFVMWQTGHSARELPVHQSMQEDWAAVPVRPVLNGEPCYEDHPINQRPDLGYFDAYDVRAAAYRSVLAGGCGHTYGHHCVWYFAKEQETGERFLMDWQEALLRPAAGQMRYLRELMEGVDFLHRRPADWRVCGQPEGANYIVGTEGEAYALFYSPNGVGFRLDLKDIAGGINGRWFDPRSGRYSAPFPVEGEAPAFRTPVKGRPYDSVLCLEWRK